MRAATLATPPVIVLLCEEPPAIDVLYVMSLFEHVYLVIGNPGNALDLSRAGVDTCAHIAIMADKSQTFKVDFSFFPKAFFLLFISF